MADPEPECVQRPHNRGCVAGAETKDQYLAAIKDAGFRGVNVAGETTFPLDMLKNDPTIKETIKSLSLTSQAVQELAKSVLSIRVAAYKPGIE